MTQFITYLGKDIYQLNDFINSPVFINSVTRDIELRCYFGKIHVPKRVDLHTSAIKHLITFNFCDSIFIGKSISIHTTTPTTISNLTVKSPVLPTIDSLITKYQKPPQIKPIKLNQYETFTNNQKHQTLKSS